MNHTSVATTPSRVLDMFRHQNVVPAGTIDIRKHANQHVASSAIEFIRMLAKGNQPLQLPHDVRKKIHSEQVRSAEIIVGAEPYGADLRAARRILQSRDQQRPATAPLMGGIDDQGMEFPGLA